MTNHPNRKRWRLRESHLLGYGSLFLFLVTVSGISGCATAGNYLTYIDYKIEPSQKIRSNTKQAVEAEYIRSDRIRTGALKLKNKSSDPVLIHLRSLSATWNNRQFSVFTDTSSPYVTSAFSAKSTTEGSSTTIVGRNAWYSGSSSSYSTEKSVANPSTEHLYPGSELDVEVIDPVQAIFDQIHDETRENIWSIRERFECPKHDFRLGNDCITSDLKLSPSCFSWGYERSTIDNCLSKFSGVMEPYLHSVKRITGSSQIQFRVVFSDLLEKKMSTAEIAYTMSDGAYVLIAQKRGKDDKVTRHVQPTIVGLNLTPFEQDLFRALKKKVSDSR